MLRRPVIISALWQYIKTHKLQDQHEKEFVNCDPFLKQIFQVVKNNTCGFLCYPFVIWTNFYKPLGQHESISDSIFVRMDQLEFYPTSKIIFL